MLGLDDPWFRPLGRRVAVCAVTLGWGVFELIGGSPLWGTAFLALGGYVGYVFFVAFDPKD